MVQAESVSIEENLVISGSVCECIAGTAYSKGLKMHYVDSVSVDSTRYKCIYLNKAEVRRYRLSLSVWRRTWL